MKRLLSILCVAALLLSMFPVNAFAVEESSNVPVISVEQSWGAVGQTVELDVVIDNNPGILGGTFTISWDENLELLSAKKQDAFEDLNYQAPSGFDRNGTNFMWYGDSVSEVLDGTFLKLTFKVSQNALSDKILPVNIVAKQMIGANSNTISATCVNGGIQVVDYIPGDVDGNRSVELLDVITLAQYVSDDCITKPNGFNVSLNEKAADVNDDGYMDLLDIILICQFVSDDCITNPDGYNVILKPVTPRCKHAKEACEANAATCTEDGNIAYWYCSKCDKYFADASGEQEITYADVVVPANHTFSEEWSYDESSHWHDATCEHKENPIDLSDHTFVNHICSVCSAEEKVLVTFVDGEGEVIGEQYVSYGAGALAPTVPERMGFVFEGWDVSFDAVTSDITVTAQYVKAHVVTFMDYDNRVLKQQSVKDGESATAYVFTELDVIPEGYERTGWDTSFDNVTEDIYVKATYARKKYTVNFYMPDGSLIDTQTVEYGSDAVEPECSDSYFDWNTYKMGEFSGWSSSLKDIKGDVSITAEYNNEYAQPVISIYTTANSASIKMYTPENCYLYAMDFGFNWSGNISIISCDKNIASDLYKGNNGASNIDYNNKYNKFHYTWTNAVGIKLEAAYTTVLDIQFATDGNQTVNKDVLKLFDECSIIYSTVPTTDMSELENIKPIVVIR